MQLRSVFPDQRWRDLKEELAHRLGACRTPRYTIISAIPTDTKTMTALSQLAAGSNPHSLCEKQSEVR